MQWWQVLTIGAIIFALRQNVTTAGFSVKRIAEAIAKAEGFGVPGAIPTVRNNPGNIRTADGPIATYRTAAAGWQALYNQVARMLAGSSLYPPTWTIEQVAARYTGEGAYMNWARIVAGELGVSTRAIFSELA